MLPFGSMEADQRKVFFKAALENRVSFIHQLIENGLDVNVTDSVGRTAAHYAARHGNTDVLMELSIFGADLNLCTRHGVSVAHQAALAGHVHFLDMLVQLGARVELTDENDLTPLEVALHAEKMESARFLEKIYATKLVVVETIVHSKNENPLEMNPPELQQQQQKEEQEQEEHKEQEQKEEQEQQEQQQEESFYENIVQPQESFHENNDLQHPQESFHENNDLQHPQESFHENNDLQPHPHELYNTDFHLDKTTCPTTTRIIEMNDEHPSPFTSFENSPNWINKMEELDHLLPVGNTEDDGLFLDGYSESLIVNELEGLLQPLPYLEINRTGTPIDVNYCKYAPTIDNPCCWKKKYRNSTTDRNVQQEETKRRRLDILPYDTNTLTNQEEKLEIKEDNQLQI